MSKTILITGGSSGIGKSVGEYLQDKGFSVYGTSRNPKNLENFSFKMKKAKIMTTTGAKFDKKVALETVVRVIDQCQHIKSSEKKVPANIKTKY